MEQQVIIEQARRGRNTDRLSIALRGLGLALLSLWLGGCALLGLGEEVTELQRDSLIGGRISGELDGEAEIHVSVHDIEAAGALHSFMSLRPARGERDYFFMLPPGRYRVLAFQDHDGELLRGAGEAAGEANQGNPIRLTTVQEERYTLDISLRRDHHLPLAPDLASAPPNSRRPAGPATLGSLTTMDNPHFSAEAAELGLWRPRQFIDEITGGLYFLEPYDPDKIPVLFIHGALGHPGNWREVVAKLDRSRYQPWLYFYPTAGSLEEISGYLAAFIGDLQLKHGFERMTLVAHSMGGLVALRSIQWLSVYYGDATPVDRLITLSTPWEGHKGAALGVKLTTTPAPSWLDMSPGSEFLQSLTEIGVPTGVEHSLLFSYRGGNSLGDKADGAVSLASQLSLPFQQSAVRVIGFNEDHHSILRSHAPVETLLTALP